MGCLVPIMAGQGWHPGAVRLYIWAPISCCMLLLLCPLAHPLCSTFISVPFSARLDALHVLCLVGKLFLFCFLIQLYIDFPALSCPFTSTTYLSRYYVSFPLFEPKIRGVKTKPNIQLVAKELQLHSFEVMCYPFVKKRCNHAFCYKHYSGATCATTSLKSHVYG